MCCWEFCLSTAKACAQTMVSYRPVGYRQVKSTSIPEVCIRQCHSPRTWYAHATNALSALSAPHAHATGVGGCKGAPHFKPNTKTGVNGTWEVEAGREVLCVCLKRSVNQSDFNESAVHITYCTHHILHTYLSMVVLLFMSWLFNELRRLRCGGSTYACESLHTGALFAFCTIASVCSGESLLITVKITSVLLRSSFVVS